MALIKDITEFNKHVSVASNLLDQSFLKYTKIAERDLKKLIGKEKFDEIEALDPDDETRELLATYSANMGLSYGIPAMTLNVTNFGVFTTVVSEGQTAQWHQIKDLNRNLLKFAFNALDDAIQLIGVEHIAKLDGLFITSVSQFEEFYSLNGSAQTFLSLIPFMRESQEQFLRATLGDCYDHKFNEDQLKKIRGAVANFAVAKAAISGSFSIESNGFLLRFEVLPWEKVEQVQQSRLEKFHQDRMDIAMGYLNGVLEFLKALPCYQAPESVSEITRKNSGLFL